MSSSKNQQVVEEISNFHTDFTPGVILGGDNTSAASIPHFFSGFVSKSGRKDRSYKLLAAFSSFLLFRFRQAIPKVS
jgi:hypothetical protein